MLSDKKGKKLSAYVPDYVVFDLETTGVSCNSDEVVEISAVKVKNGEITDEFSTLVNPGRKIPWAATNVNGITDDMVADAPPFEEAFSQFLDFVGDAVLVGHNIHSFDMRFLYRDAERFWGKTLGNDYIDTLMIARRYLPGLASRALTELASYYCIDTDGAHRALQDCRMNQKVFEKLRGEMEHPSEDAESVKICPDCGEIMVRRNGRYGEFWGCSGYPECTHTEKI